MSDHEKPLADTVALVLDIGEQLRQALCDHQAFFVVVLDEHTGAMPAVEDMMKRTLAERQRAADALRMWADRIESGRLPVRSKA